MRFRDVVHEAAKHWGSIERAKMMIRQLEDAQKEKCAASRARAQAKERLLLQQLLPAKAAFTCYCFCCSFIPNEITP
jgi:hypothetical protein